MMLALCHILTISGHYLSSHRSDTFADHAAYMHGCPATLLSGCVSLGGLCIGLCEPGPPRSTAKDLPPPPSPPFPPRGQGTNHKLQLSMVGHNAGGAAAPKAATAVEEGEAVPQPMLGKPFVEVQWEMLHHNPSILYFRALLLQIQVCSAAHAGHLIM